MATKTTTARCQMCGAVPGKPHHDPNCNGVIVELAPHTCLLPEHCWVHGLLVCQPCLQGGRENELEKSGTPEGLLARAARLQTEFWDALSDLEAALDIEVDGTQELEGMTIEDLKAQAEPEDEDDDEPGDDDKDTDEEARA